MNSYTLGNKRKLVGTLFPENTIYALMYKKNPFSLEVLAVNVFIVIQILQSSGDRKSFINKQKTGPINKAEYFI